jgi:hypothetical protein
MRLLARWKSFTFPTLLTFALTSFFITSTAYGGDIFADFFSGGGSQRSGSTALPYATDSGVGDFGAAPAAASEIKPRRVYIFRKARPMEAKKVAFCVRTCDGRYFPVVAADGESRAASCNSFCPASETKIFQGTSIDKASNDAGKAYSDMPNAFRYRNELVAGCTCNGKDQIGLASIKAEDDPTLLKGDIVASDKGLMIAGRRSASLNFTPAPKSIRAQFERAPVIASQ